MAYLVSFSISVLFAYLANKVKQNRSKFLFVVLSAICILIPAVLGGLRAYSIGTDVMYYVLPDLGWANSYTEGMKNFLFKGTEREILYSVLVYWVGKASGAVYWDYGSLLLFIFQLITITCVYVGAYRNRDRVSPALVLLLFFCFQYNSSYNMIRQMLAEVIVFAGVAELFNKNYKRFILYSVGAMLFHIASIITLILIPIHYGVTRYNYNRKKEKMFEFAVIVGILVGMVSVRRICIALINVGILSSKYLYYVENLGDASSNTETLIYVGVFALYFVLSERIYESKPETDFYRMNLILSVATLQLGRIISWGNRFGMYFSIFNIIAIAAIPKMFKRGKSRTAVTVLIVIISLIYWWYIYVYCKVGATYPYKTIFDA